MQTARRARSEATDQERDDGSPGSGHHPVALRRPTEQREQASVQRYLDRFAEVMTAGDTRALTQLWGVPAFVIGRARARVLRSDSDVEQLVADAKVENDARGVTQIRAEIQRLDWVGTDLVVATVRWSYMNDAEDELGEETCSYTLLRGEDGSYKVRSVLLRSTTGLGVGAADEA